MYKYFVDDLGIFKKYLLFIGKVVLYIFTKFLLQMYCVRKLDSNLKVLSVHFTFSLAIFKIFAVSYLSYRTCNQANQALYSTSIVYFYRNFHKLNELLQDIILLCPELIFLNIYLCAHFCRYSPIYFFDNLMTEWGGVKSKFKFEV